MYSSLPAFVIGFHGCDKSVADKVVCGKEPMNKSENDYDWLGHGIYFWENDPSRALDYADKLMKNPTRATSKIEKPAVIGAVIDLGLCLNLMEIKLLEEVKTAHEDLCAIFKQANEKMPENKGANDNSSDLLIRRLDCAVIQYLCASYSKKSGRGFDSVRGLFFEGPDLYPNAGFKTKNHIQICVRNPNCIKGYFLPRNRDKKYPVP